MRRQDTNVAEAQKQPEIAGVVVREFVVLACQPNVDVKQDKFPGEIMSHESKKDFSLDLFPGIYAPVHSECDDGHLPCSKNM